MHRMKIGGRHHLCYTRGEILLFGALLILMATAFTSAFWFGRLERCQGQLRKAGASLSSLGRANRTLAQSAESLGQRVHQLSLVNATKVTVTCYNSEAKQTDSTPWVNAINRRVGPGQVAVSRDLLYRGFSFGRRVWVENHGIYTITDTTHERLTATVDIWQETGKKPFKHDNVLAVLLAEE